MLLDTAQGPSPEASFRQQQQLFTIQSLAPCQNTHIVVLHTYWVTVWQDQAVHGHQQLYITHTGSLSYRIKLYTGTNSCTLHILGHCHAESSCTRALTVVHHTYLAIILQDQAIHRHQQTVVHHRYWVIVIQDPTTSPAHLLYVLLCTHVRRLQQVASESHIAVHCEWLLRMVCVHPNTANVVNRLTGVTFLPHDIHITVKLTRVGSLKETSQINYQTDCCFIYIFIPSRATRM